MIVHPAIPAVFGRPAGFGDPSGVNVDTWTEPANADSGYYSMGFADESAFPITHQTTDHNATTGSLTFTGSDYTRHTRSISVAGAESSVANSTVTPSSAGGWNWRPAMGSYGLGIIQKQGAGSGAGTLVWTYANSVGNNVTNPWDASGSQDYYTIDAASTAQWNNVMYVPGTGIYTIGCGSTARTQGVTPSYGVHHWAHTSQSTSPGSTYTYRREIATSAPSNVSWAGWDSSGKVYMMDFTGSTWNLRIFPADLSSETTIAFGTGDPVLGGSWIGTSWAVLRDGQEVWVGDTVDDNQVVRWDISDGATKTRIGLLEIDGDPVSPNVARSASVWGATYSNYVYYPEIDGGPKYFKGG